MKYMGLNALKYLHSKLAQSIDDKISALQAKIEELKTELTSKAEQNDLSTLNTLINKLPVKLITSTYNTLTLNSAESSIDSKEGSQITFFGLGGNSGEEIHIDAYNNELRIFSKFGTDDYIIYKFTADGFYKNGTKIG